MTIQSIITNEDWNVYVQFIRRRITQDAGSKTNRWLLAVGLGVLLGLIISIGKISTDLLSVFIGAFGMVMWIKILTRTQLKVMQPSPDGVLLGSCSINIGDEGIKTITPSCETFYRWKTVRGTEVTDKNIFIIVDNIAAITIPRRSFKATDEQEQFLGEIQKHVSS
jgi:hypothetical protein